MSTERQKKRWYQVRAQIPAEGGEVKEQVSLPMDFNDAETMRADFAEAGIRSVSEPCKAPPRKRNLRHEYLAKQADMLGAPAGKAKKVGSHG